jgi:hypothetical protein
MGFCCEGVKLKVKANCAECLLHRGIREIELATPDPEVKMRALKELLKLLSDNFSENSVPAILGTERDRLIRKETGCPDPYKEKKSMSNNYAFKVLPRIRNTLKSELNGYRRFRKACLAAIVANSIEFDMLEHDQKLQEFPDLLDKAEEELGIDDIREIYSKAEDSKKILYLLDNAGEIVVDSLLIEEMKKIGPSVVAVVKEGPVLNDATMEDAILAGIPNIADEVVSTGMDSVGLVLSQSSEILKKHLNESDLIISKGMGNFETTTEERIENKCVAYLLRAKCSPVAENLKVRTGSNVAWLHCWD